jgi:ATP-binding cassette subfamily B protein
VAERGTHDELLAQGGLYADMWARQAEQDAEAAFARDEEREALAIAGA